MIYKPTQGLISAGGFRTHARYRGCVGHWPIHSGGGLKIFDVSGFKNDGDLLDFLLAGGHPTWVGQRFGPALLFDGISNYSSLGDVRFGSPTSLTVAAWVTPMSNTGRNDFVTRWDFGGASNRTFNLLHGTTNGKFQFYIENTADVIQNSGVSTTSISVGTLYHVVGMCDGANIRLFVNGVQENSAAQTGTLNWSTGPSVQIGSDTADTFPHHFNGFIHDVRIYNRALKADEVASLYKYPFLEFQLRRKHVIKAPAVVSPFPPWKRPDPRLLGPMLAT